MASGARAAGSQGGAARDIDRNEGRTPAQWFAYIFGAVLLLVGILGFFADATFDTGQPLDGNRFLDIFEVNGIHNVVHVLSGLFLLAVAGKRKSAKTGVLAFGLIYAVVTLIGLIDGKDVLSLIPINPADNILHIALTVAAIAAALASKANDEDGRGRAHA